MLGQNHVRVRMMMSNEPDNFLEIRLVNIRSFKKRVQQRWTFLFLLLSDRASILFTTERAGDIMHDRRPFKDLLCVRLEVFTLSNGLCVGVNLQKMIHIMRVSMVKRNHFLNQFEILHTNLRQTTNAL